MNKQLLLKLANLANELDSRGLLIQADKIDHIVKKAFETTTFNVVFKSKEGKVNPLARPFSTKEEAEAFIKQIEIIEVKRYHMDISSDKI